MNFTVEKIANVAALIVGVALASVIVSSKNTRGIIRGVTGGFADSIRAAKGR